MPLPKIAGRGPGARLSQTGRSSPHPV